MSRSEAVVPERPALALETSKRIGALAKKEFATAAEYKQRGKPVAWVHLGGVMELVRAFDIATLYPENYGAAMAAARVAAPCIDVAERRGYPRYMCSYFTINCGFTAGAKDLPGIKFPAGGLIMPDLLLPDSISCVHRVGWFRVIQDILKVPTFVFDGPFFSQRMSRDQIDGHVLEYMVSQMKELIAFLEEHTGQKFDEERLREVMKLSQKTTELAQEIADLMGKTVPCPAGVEDQVYWLYALNCLLGTPDSVEFLQAVRDEVKGKVEKGEGCLPEEKYRLMFTGNVPYYALGVLSYLHKYGAIFVGDPILCITFCNPLVPLNLENPYETLARKYLGYWLNLSYDKCVEIHNQYVEEYKVDGVVFCVQKGCKVASGPMWHIKNAVQKRYGIPCLFLELEQADPQDYSPVQVARMLDDFMETVETRKRERKRKQAA
jgi:benzoyl-CoA reductase/2-hydroxyglutaryl-CoA dehydratase subunit BcrC/BadD/HgdB